MKKVLNAPFVIAFCERLLDGVKLLYDSCRECHAPSHVVLSLADAISSLQSVLTVFKCVGIKE